MRVTETQPTGSQGDQTMETKMVQFQCQANGEIFYYQHAPQYAEVIATRCPVCGSKRVKPTGRLFAAVDENKTGRNA